MSQLPESENAQKDDPKLPERRPNEQAGFYFSGFVKISDPETGQVLLQTRTD